MTNGNVLKSMEVNFNIIDGKLHYIENGVIMSAEMVQVSSVVTESATYLNVWGRMMKVVASDEKGYVLRSVEVDKDKMAKTDIGYGISSATASSQNVTSLLGDSATLLVNMDISQALSKRAAGKVFPTMETLYLKINSDILPATKKMYYICHLWINPRQTPFSKPTRSSGRTRSHCLKSWISFMT